MRPKGVGSVAQHLARPYLGSERVPVSPWPRMERGNLGVREGSYAVEPGLLELASTDSTAGITMSFAMSWAPSCVRWTWSTWK